MLSLPLDLYFKGIEKRYICFLFSLLTLRLTSVGSILGAMLECYIQIIYPKNLTFPPHRQRRLRPPRQQEPGRHQFQEQRLKVPQVPRQIPTLRRQQPQQSRHLKRALHRPYHRDRQPLHRYHHHRNRRRIIIHV